MNKISIKNIFKQFDQNIIIDNQSFNLEAGIYRLAGNNGTGKSTLLNILGGIDSDFQGEVSIDRNNLLFLDDKDIGLNPFTIKENILILMKLFKIPSTSTTDKIIKDFFDGKEDLRYSQASVGTKMKVGLILILLKNWDIILLDESFSTIDTKSRQLIVDKLLSLKEKAIIIYVAHSEVDERLTSVATKLELKAGKLYVEK
ncbi:MAG: ATP-binding cassette domain-containing protein [Lactobacillaceae bacterium]|nr:ATP-binding cassette domain-containing protein [Lactobacillaceae bacterium]